MKKSYRSPEWQKYSDIIKIRDNYSCLKCGRKQDEKVILQVHHTNYKSNLKPWEYPFSDCQTLCKGCHSRVHNLVEPNSGWMLVSIDDLEDMSGVCEKNGCSKPIRYLHLVYHPNWGYLNVGSKCVVCLTIEDKYISEKIVNFYKKTSSFIKKSEWQEGTTPNGEKFIYTIYKSNGILLFNEQDTYSYKIALKLKGKKKYDISEKYNTFKSNIEQAKELGFIALYGKIAKNEQEKKYLRDIYKATI